MHFLIYSTLPLIWIGRCDCWTNILKHLLYRVSICQMSIAPSNSKWRTLAIHCFLIMLIESCPSTFAVKNIFNFLISLSFWRVFWIGKWSGLFCFILSECRLLIGLLSFCKRINQGLYYRFWAVYSTQTFIGGDSRGCIYHTLLDISFWLFIDCWLVGLCERYYHINDCVFDFQKCCVGCVFNVHHREICPRLQ